MTERIPNRPYFMMHEGRQIFSAWIRTIVADYCSNFGPHTLRAANPSELMAAVRNMKANFAEIDEHAFEQHIAPNIDAIARYTSSRSHVMFSSVSPMAGLGPTNFTSLSVRRRRELDELGVQIMLGDTLDFAMIAPTQIALDTNHHNPLLMGRQPVVAARQMLRSSSFQASMDALALTGFDVLRASHFGLEKGEPDYGRANRRERLQAAPDDTELIIATRRGTGFQYSVAPWAEERLRTELMEQNRTWPDHFAASPTRSGNLGELPGPISAGCPVRGLEIGPFCTFLSNQIHYIPEP